jgi:serine phosphatase RsbU (regulator of sigma subunit)
MRKNLTVYCALCSTGRVRQCGFGGVPNQLVERLESTSTVLGMFEKWDCTVGEVELRAGDILVIYTDGINEAPNTEWEEFGEDRLM